MMPPMLRLRTPRALPLVLLTLMACHSSSPSTSDAGAPEPSASAGSGALPSGVFCAEENAAACYDVDATALRVTLVMDGKRGGAYPLTQRPDGSYSFAMAPDQPVQIRVSDDNTLSVGAGANMATLKRK
jgi:hypothetical protein